MPPKRESAVSPEYLELITDEVEEGLFDEYSREWFKVNWWMGVNNALPGRKGKPWDFADALMNLRCLRGYSTQDLLRILEIQTKWEGYAED